MNKKNELINFYNELAPSRKKWKKFNSFYHKTLQKYYQFLIPENSRVLEIGCGTGELLNSVNPSYGVGIDFSEEMLKVARDQFPQLKFINQDVEQLDFSETFDYIIISDLLGALLDIQEFFRNLKKVCHDRTRIIISFHNFLWEPILNFTERVGLKIRQPVQNWLSRKDIENLLYLEGFDGFKHVRKSLVPFYFPVLNFIINRVFANLPLIEDLNLINFLIARPSQPQSREYTVSIIVPARNEKGNIENAILRTPVFGKAQEFIFVEGNSADGTYEEILRIQEKFKEKQIAVFKQSGIGKGNAVREAFDKATGEILMILDADLTTPPEDLPKFYYALKDGKGEFINGCRLVYPMEKEAMRFLNLIANKCFGILFSFLLNQRLKDTLCGTKVLFKTDYEIIKKNRKYFGEFDPFGDFDLLFGASKLNLKITEVLVRYREREYGRTQISRFRHGLLLMRMCLFAARKIRFI